MSPSSLSSAVLVIIGLVWQLFVLVTLNLIVLSFLTPPPSSHPILHTPHKLPHTSIVPLLVPSDPWASF